MASVQLLQVVNTSVNFPIYWFVGNFRETFLNLFCGSREGKSLKDHNSHNGTNFEMVSRQSWVSSANTDMDNSITGYAYEKLEK